MIIKELEIINFRQFYGTQKITFAYGSKNITLIQGNNGAGKTSIYRALMFVLYGDDSLKQDKLNKDLNLVNLQALEENLGSPVKGYVKIKFTNDDIDYELEREVVAVKTAEKIIKKIEQPRLYKNTNIGDFIEVSADEDQVQRIINSIIAPEIKEFFFYDAEEMNLLDSQSIEKTLSEDIKRGVMNILQIEYLEKGINQIDQEIKSINRKIREFANNDKELTEKHLESMDFLNNINVLKENKKNMVYEMDLMKNEIEDLTRKLESGTEKKYALDTISHYEELIKEKKSIIFEKKKQLKPLINNCAILYGMNIFLKNEKDLENILINRPDRIPEHFLAKSLEDGSCYLCHNEIKKDSLEYSYIIKLLKEYEINESTEIINLIIKSGTKYKEDEKFIDEAIETIKYINGKINEIEEKQLAIDTLKRKYHLNKDNSEEIKKLFMSREKINNDYENKKHELAILESNVSQLEKKKSRLDIEIKNLEENKYKEKEELRIKSSLIKIKGALSFTIDEYSKKMIIDLSKETESTFRSLISRENLDFNSIEINENFKISVMDNTNENIIQDLSAGQQQLLSLSFVLSLAKIATKGVDEIQFPLFMDTPFARLSSENRINVIKNIPNITDQWILLLTDTEFTTTEKEIFDQGSRVGQFYNLIKEDGKTIIKKRGH